MKPYDDIQLLDVVALTEDLYEYGLRRGHVGTVVEKFDNDFFEIEFNDNEGITYAMVAIEKNQLLVLHYKRDLVA